MPMGVGEDAGGGGGGGGGALQFMKEGGTFFRV